MSKKVVLSGVPHSVQTNERTRNAINPRNSFVENERQELRDISEEFEKSNADVPHGGQDQLTTQDTLKSDESPSVAKTHVTEHREKINLDQTMDEVMFYETIHQIEDRIQNLRRKNPSQNTQRLGRTDIEDNYQSLGKVDRLTDNWQPVNEKVVGDNFQDVGPAESRQDTILFKEKKNIHENFQKFPELQQDRSSVAMESQSRVEKTSQEHEDLTLEDLKQAFESPLHTELNEEELRARLRQIKAKLSKANRELKDIEENK